MSFILDALKKSETDRQQQSSAEFAGVPRSDDSPAVPRWLWVLALLLAINLAVLLGLLMRPDAAAPILPATPVNKIQTPVVDEPSFAEQLADAKQNMPAVEEPEVVVPDTPHTLGSAEPEVTAITAVRQPSTVLPTIYEVQADGSVVLPELHLDIHVYSDVPEDRFVFINMSKQREDSQLAEGPVVEEITPEGVVLEYRGTSFLLPRD